MTRAQAKARDAAARILERAECWTEASQLAPWRAVYLSRTGAAARDLNLAALVRRTLGDDPAKREALRGHHAAMIANTRSALRRSEIDTARASKC